MLPQQGYLVIVLGTSTARTRSLPSSKHRKHCLYLVFLCSLVRGKITSKCFCAHRPAGMLLIHRSRVSNFQSFVSRYSRRILSIRLYRNLPRTLSFKTMYHKCHFEILFCHQFSIISDPICFKIGLRLF